MAARPELILFAAFAAGAAGLGCQKERFPTSPAPAKQHTEAGTEQIGGPKAVKADPSPTLAHVNFDDDFAKNWKRTEFGSFEVHDYQPGMVTVDAGSPFSGINYVGDAFPRTGYRLQLDARKDDGTDFFCCLTFPVNDQACSLVIGGWGGTVTGISCIDGRDASENATTTVRKYNQGQWYQIKVEVTEERLRAWVDGESIVDLPLADVELSVRTDVQACLPVGLCSFATRASWKNFRCEKLH